MKKLCCILLFFAYAHITTVLGHLQEKNPVENLVHIMITDSKLECPYNLANARSPNDYQDVYNLAKKHPELLQGIIHNQQTFAMLCLTRGYVDLLACLFNEGLPVDFSTPCHLFGPNEPQTAILNELLSQVYLVRTFRELYPDDYIKCITALTKLIIKKHPDLLDLPLYRHRTARQDALFFYKLYDLIPLDLQQFPGE